MYPLTQPSDLLTIASVVVLAGLLHANFQLAVSVLTRLGAHVLGRNDIRRQHQRHLAKAAAAYAWGNFLMIGLLATGVTYVLSALVTVPQKPLWVMLSLLGGLTGLAVLLIYRRDGGRRLWIPEALKNYLYERTKRSTTAAESLALGMVTGLAELPFIAAPLLFVAALLRGAPDLNRLAILLLYAAIASAPLFLLAAAMGAGQQISRLERWRESNRRFLQLSSALGLAVLSVYVLSLFGAGSSPW